MHSIYGDEQESSVYTQTKMGTVPSPNLPISRWCLESMIQKTIKDYPAKSCLYFGEL